MFVSFGLRLVLNIWFGFVMLLVVLWVGLFIWFCLASRTCCIIASLLV